MRGGGRVARALGVALALGLGLVSAGCGEGRGPGVATRPLALRTVTGDGLSVSLAEYRLMPANPRIATAGRIAIEVSNDGDGDHALAVEEPSGEARTRTLAPGQRTTLTVRLPPGIYKWYSPLGDDERLGMAGHIHVGGS